MDFKLPLAVFSQTEEDHKKTREDQNGLTINNKKSFTYQFLVGSLGD